MKIPTISRLAAPTPPLAPAPAASLALAVSPEGVFHLDDVPSDSAEGPALPADVAARIREAFTRGAPSGLLHLATAELASDLPPSLAFGREVGRRFLSALCHLEDPESSRAALTVPASPEDIADLMDSAPPMTGAEYLSEGALTAAWDALTAEVASELTAFSGTVEQYLHAKNPAWNTMGRVCFHLAENKANETAPFAFMATYARGVSKQGRVLHAPLGKAIEEYAAPGKKAELLRLLSPVQRAAEKSAFVRGLVESGEIFHPVAWRVNEAYSFLKDTPALESSGVLVRVPDWWRSRNPPRPQISVTIGKKAPSQVGTDALLDFDVGMVLDGEPLSREEQRALLEGAEGLRLIKGRWVEVSGDKLREVLAHWRAIQKQAARGELSFIEGMRLLAGMPRSTEAAAGPDPGAAAWSRVTAGPWLDGVLADLRKPEGHREADPGEALKGTLRPYQRDGVAWLWLLSRLGLGACLADDMGLGKTIQVLSLLLLLKKNGRPGPHLLVVPASLLGNWQSEMARFAPDLVPSFVHPSFGGAGPPGKGQLKGVDVVVTTYATLLRAPWIGETAWGHVVLDEAQAIKNPGAKQTRAVKALKSGPRLALTGTPVENNLGDLWSIFDFLCPGLLGPMTAFRRHAKHMADAPGGYAPLRNLVRPYILRRLKSDRRIAGDLPDKVEVNVYCPLTKKQATLYGKTVSDLAREIDTRDGMERRGLILAYLMRFKQICNHPSQWSGDGAYEPGDSGKLLRLRELVEPVAARQEKALVFTQFREMTGPLAAFLSEVFGRPGLVLHGETPVKERAALVADFQRDGGPPFFVLSLKAGGTGLNLTAASHVIHFDRWWNPAVENQATDRAYRIGQRKNVMVHKLVCRGTVEERIDAMIASKRALQEELLAPSGEAWITEMESDELLRLVSLDLHTALEVE